MFKDLDDAKLAELLETLVDLSLDGETFEICLAALRLQSELLNRYQPVKVYQK
jgi:hypothetical protein